MKSIFTFLALFYISLSNAQTWETLLPQSDRNGEFEITQSSSGEYLIAGINKLISLSANGDFLSEVEAPVFPDNFGHAFENSFYSFRSNTSSDSLLVYKINRAGITTDTTFINYPEHTYRNGTGVVNDDLFIAQIIKRGTNDYTLISFNARGELINEQKDFIEGTLFMTNFNKFYIVNRGRIDEYDLELNLVNSILDEEVSFISALTANENGDVFFAAGEFDTGVSTLGKIDPAGNITTNTFQTTQGQFTDFYGYPHALAVNGSSIAVISTTIESNELLDVDCFDEKLQFTNSFKRDNGGFMSNIIANNSGGFTFGFGESIDPQANPFAAQKKPVFYSVDANCNLTNAASRTTGRVYLDKNSNEVFDNNDSPLQNIKLLILPDSIFTYTNEEGIYDVRINPGENELTIVPLQNCFESDITYNFSASEISNDDTFDFPLEFFNNNRSLDIVVTTAPTRCNLTVPYFITVKNTGCSDVTGTLTLANNNLLLKPEFEQDYSYEINDLSPYSQDRRRLYYSIPSENYAGDTLELYLNFDSDGISIDTTIRRIVRCGVDPNDKMIEPRIADPAGSLFAERDQELTYTIRFQNLGNDTAFNIRIDDELLPDFDLETFEPIAESHTSIITVDGNLLSYQFDNILLPPASIDEPNSHGFVKFKIKVKQDLPDFTETENTAGIFFDLNEPIITNTVIHTVVEFLDADGDDFYFWDDCDDLDPAINPGQEEIVNNGIDDNCDGNDIISSTQDLETIGKLVYPNPAYENLNIRLDDAKHYILEIINTQGQLLKTYKDPKTIPINNLADGIYFIKLKNLSNNQIYIDKIIIAK